MDFDYQTLFFCLMALLLVGAVLAKLKSSRPMPGQRQHGNGTTFKLVDYGNATWLQARVSTSLSFSLGDASVSEPGARTVRVAGCALTTNSQELIEQLEGSQKLQKLVAQLFRVDQGVVRAFVVRGRESVITLHQPSCRWPLNQHEIPELREFLARNFSRIEQELHPLDTRQLLNSRSRR
jgi:hypothetical protein